MSASLLTNSPTIPGDNHSDSDDDDYSADDDSGDSDDSDEDSDDNDGDSERIGIFLWLSGVCLSRKDHNNMDSSSSASIKGFSRVSPNLKIPTVPAPSHGPVRRPVLGVVDRLDLEPDPGEAGDQVGQVLQSRRSLVAP